MTRIFFKTYFFHSNEIGEEMKKGSRKTFSQKGKKQKKKKVMTNVPMLETSFKKKKILSINSVTLKEIHNMTEVS